jgi:4-amino-4-deoxy-L-arabinose transferase-like glycosyltransferase
LGIALFLLAFAVTVVRNESAYLWDEAMTLSDAENWFASQPYFNDGAVRAPLLPVLLYAGSRMLALESWAQVVSAGFFALGAMVLFVLGNRLYGRRTALLSAGLVVTSPFFLHQAQKVMADVPATAVALASLYFLLRNLPDGEAGPGDALPAGLLLGLAWLLRFNAAWLMVPAVYLFLLRRLNTRAASYYTAGFFAALAPYLAWAQFRYGNFLRPFFETLNIIARDEAVPGRSLHLEAIFIIAGPLTVIGLCCYLYGVRESWSAWKARDGALLLTTALFLAYLAVAGPSEPRAALPVIPLLFLLAARGMAALQGQRFIGPAVAVILVAAIYPASQYAYFSGRRDLGEDVLLQRSAETRTAAQYLQQYLPPGQVVYSSSLYPLLAYYSKRNTVILWPWDDSFYTVFPRNMRQEGYLVYYKDVPKAPYQEWLDGRKEFRKVREYEHIVIYAYRPG